mmetsp:Transcript_6567/g.14045  ORF Transcript_6567/g.14045 Transcript_6567/m.14045 type:complete len:91 (+) Transcript_6567:387-659(+)
MVNSDKAWTWSVTDFSEDEGFPEVLALKFGSKELADKFKEVFEHSCKWNQSIKENVEKGEPWPVFDEVTALTEQVQKTEIKEDKKEEKKD